MIDMSERKQGYENNFMAEIFHASAPSKCDICIFEHVQLSIRNKMQKSEYSKSNVNSANNTCSLCFLFFLLNV